MMELRHVKYILITIGIFLGLSFLATFLYLFFSEFIILLILVGIAYAFIRYTPRRRSPKWLLGLRKKLKNFYWEFYWKINQPLKRSSRSQKYYPSRRVRYGKNIKIETRIFNSVNKIRQRHRLPALSWDDNLYSTAQRRAKEISWNFSHDGVPSSCGENIAQIPFGNVRGLGFVQKQNISQKFVNTWMRSPGHRQNILRGSYHSIAIGVFQKGRKYYAVQLFS